MSHKMCTQQQQQQLLWNWMKAKKKKEKQITNVEKVEATEISRKNTSELKLFVLGNDWKCLTSIYMWYLKDGCARKYPLIDWSEI